MTKIVYEVVEHHGGWAYRVDGVFSETFPSHDLARQAADRASACGPSIRTMSGPMISSRIEPMMDANIAC